MWREYTREHPARPRLALWTTLGVFAGTVALAQFIVSARSPVEGFCEGPQSPAFWPFAFDLPAGYSWSPDEQTAALPTMADGNGGAAVFAGEGTGGGKAMLLVSFAVLPPGTTAAEAAERLLRVEFVAAGPIRLGPIDGQIETIATPSSTRMAAAGCLPSGVGVGLTYVTTAADEQAVEEFRAVCRSIAFKDWWIEP